MVAGREKVRCIAHFFFGSVGLRIAFVFSLNLLRQITFTITMKLWFALVDT